MLRIWGICAHRSAKALNLKQDTDNHKYVKENPKLLECEVEHGSREQDGKQGAWIRDVM